MAGTDSVDYESLKVTELKALLKERGIPSTGLTRKAQIIEALQVSDADFEATEADDGNKAEEEADVADENGGPEEDSAEGKDGEVAVALASGEAQEAAKEEDAGVAKEEESEESTDAHKAKPSDANTGNAANEEVKQMEEKETQETPPPVTAKESPQQAATAEDDPQAPVPSAETANVPQTPPPATSDAEKASYPSSVDGSEIRKRKRRSPTPPLDEETVIKRLKSVDESELPILPEDNPTDPRPEQSIVREVVMDESESAQLGSVEDDMEVDIPPATHPATCALYIRDLLRPLQQAQLRDHLTTLAAPPNPNSENVTLEQLHLDGLKTHAFALFSSIAAASRVRTRLHGKTWPEESTRKPLWVDFVPEQKLQQWIEREEAEGGSRSNAKRWEVMYTTDPSTGSIETELRETHPGLGRQSSFANASQQGFGQGMPGAPAGPRGSRPSIPNTSIPPPAAPSAPREPSIDTSATKTPAFSDLDERYPSTTARPKIYFLPVAAELVDKRLDELDAKTSRDWLDTGGKPVGGRGDQLRRYTFDDGDQLVDGGADFGGFGRAKGAGGGDSFRPGGGGGRGGGRYRGR